MFVPPLSAKEFTHSYVSFPTPPLLLSDIINIPRSFNKSISRAGEQEVTKELAATQLLSHIFRINAKYRTQSTLNLVYSSLNLLLPLLQKSLFSNKQPFIQSCPV